ncbi:MAG: hypothetical protein C4345_12805 [Chloroflexota bacterium]
MVGAGDWSDPNGTVTSWLALGVAPPCAAGEPIHEPRRRRGRRSLARGAVGSGAALVGSPIGVVVVKRWVTLFLRSAWMGPFQWTRLWQV